MNILTRKNDIDFRTYQLEKSIEIPQDKTIQVIDPNLLEQNGGEIINEFNINQNKINIIKQCYI